MTDYQELPKPQRIPTRHRRNHAIDHLRAAMICIVMFGHAMLPYVTVPRRFKDPSTHIAFDIIGLFLYSFAMPLFFVTAGFAAAAMLQQRGFIGLIRNRFHSILLPLLGAYLILSPLTRATYVFASTASKTGSLVAATDVLCAGEWLRWSKTYHLWFLVALLLYTGLSLGLLKLIGPLATSSLERFTSKIIISPWRLAWLSMFAAFTLIPAYVFYAGDATTLPMQLHLFGFFLFGWLLYNNREFLPAMATRPWRPFAVAMLLTPLAAWAARQRLFSPDTVDLGYGILAGGAYAIVVAGMTISLLGYFHARFSEHPSAFGLYISQASYWIFLIHFPLLIFVGGLLSVTLLPALVKYLLCLSIVIPLVMISYHYGIRTTPAGRLLKGRKPKK